MIKWVAKILEHNITIFNSLKANWKKALIKILLKTKYKLSGVNNIPPGLYFSLTESEINNSKHSQGYIWKNWQ